MNPTHTGPAVYIYHTGEHTIPAAYGNPPHPLSLLNINFKEKHWKTPEMSLLRMENER